jgi:hypothetical protein
MSFKVEKFGLFREDAYELSVIIDHANASMQERGFCCRSTDGNINKIDLTGYRQRLECFNEKRQSPRG